MKNENLLDLLYKIQANAVLYLSNNPKQHEIKKAGFDFSFFENLIFVYDGNIRLLSCSKHENRIELSLPFINAEKLIKISDTLTDIIYIQAEQKLKESKAILQQFHENKLKQINEE